MLRGNQCQMESLSTLESNFLQSVVRTEAEIKLSIIVDDNGYIPMRMLEQVGDKRLVSSIVYEFSHRGKLGFLQDNCVQYEDLPTFNQELAKNLAQAARNKGVVDSSRHGSYTLQGSSQDYSRQVVLGLSVLSKKCERDNLTEAYFSVVDNSGHSVCLFVRLPQDAPTFVSSYFLLCTLSKFLQECSSTGQCVELPLIHPFFYQLSIDFEWKEILMERSLEEDVSEVINGRSNSMFLFPGRDNPKHIEFFPFNNAKKNFEVVVLCGSFNPLHLGHEAIINFSADYVRKLRKNPDLEVLQVCELCVRNPDKGVIAPDVVMNRIRQFSNTVEGEDEVYNGFNNKNGPYASMLLSPTHSLFVSKSHILKNSFLALGYDTAVRLIDPKYYEHDNDKMVANLLEMKFNGIKMLVFGRLNSSTGEFEDFGEQHEQLPVFLREMFYVITEKEFRFDLSSTHVRRQMEG